MAAYPVSVVVGSLRRDSYNRRFADALALMAPVDFTFTQVSIGELPHYNQDDDDHPSKALQGLKTTIGEARGVLFVTPEYNRSIPGVLKNVLDLGSRPSGKSAWKGKPAGIIGVSAGVNGTAMAQQHLRNVLAALDMPTLNQPEAFIQYKEGLFAADGSIGDASKTFVQKWLDQYTAWVRKIAG